MQRGDARSAELASRTLSKTDPKSFVNSFVNGNTDTKKVTNAMLGLTEDTTFKQIGADTWKAKSVKNDQKIQELGVQLKQATQRGDVRSAKQAEELLKKLK